MKSFTLASAFFAAAAVAQPHANPHGNHHRRHHQNDKRDVVTEVEWVTEIEYVTKMVDATTTVWVRPEAEPTTAPQPETTQPAPKKAEAAAEPTSQYVAPVEPTTQAPAPKPTTQAPKPVVKAPKKEPEPETEVAPVQQEKAAKPASGGSDTKHGEFTYYDIGQGACGEDDTGKDDSINIVALSHLLMGELSNNNPMCGKTITIKANGKTCQATVADKCMGCAINDIDVSRKVYEEIWGSLDSGRTEVEWWFN
ncbi:RlpA-like domain superfamily [Fusarium oxysporum f. sp. vasinfectum]|nr:RlpA-like domain superfamily [Fusarium oxysporum f. sp. vasinfectum]